MRGRRYTVVAGCAALLLASALASVVAGSRGISPGQVLDALLSPDGSEESEIVRSMRVPRTVTGLAVGAGLALAGVL